MVRSATIFLADSDEITAHRYLPTLESLLTSPSGKAGWLCSFYNVDSKGNATGKSVAEFELNDTRVKLNDFIPEGLGAEWSLKLRGILKVDKTMPFELGLTVAGLYLYSDSFSCLNEVLGRAKLWINNKLTIDNWTTQRPGDFFYG